MARLGDVVAISASTQQINEEQTWLLNLDMVEQQTGNILSYNFVSKDKLNGSIIQFDTGNILYSKLRPNLNKVVVPNQSGFATSEMLPLRPDTRILTRDYLAAYLRSDGFVNWAISKAAGAKMPRLGTKELLNKDIPVPTIDRQTQITGVLERLANMVSLRKQQIAKLDELVKAQFVEMFGDENQMNQWPCGYISDVTDVCVGVVIKPTQYYTSIGIPAFRSLNVGEMRVKNSDWVYFTEEGHKKNPKSIIRENDVLVVRSGAPGTACVASEEFAGYNAVDIIIAHPNQNKVNSIFLAQFTNMPHGMNQIREKTGGAAQQHFNVSGYKSLKLILPPLNYQNQFAKFVEDTDKARLTIQQSLDKLDVLKKALMQEYFG